MLLFIALYIGLSTRKKDNVEIENTWFYCPLYRAVYVQLKVGNTISIECFIALYIGLSTRLAKEHQAEVKKSRVFYCPLYRAVYG